MSSDNFSEKYQWLNYRAEWDNVSDEDAIRYLNSIINNTQLNCGAFSTVNYEYVIYLGQKFVNNVTVQKLIGIFNKKIYEGFKHKSKLFVAVGHTFEQEKHVQEVLGEERSLNVLNASYLFADLRPYPDYRPLK